MDRRAVTRSDPVRGRGGEGSVQRVREGQGTPDGEDTDIELVREFDAPSDRVFRLFTTASGVASWLGPAGHEVPLESVVVEPVDGGRWEATMVERGTGRESLVRGRIGEIVEPDFIILRMEADTGHGHLGALLLQLEFIQVEERTELRLHQGPFSGNADAARLNWQEAFRKIDEVLAAGV